MHKMPLVAILQTTVLTREKKESVEKRRNASIALFFNFVIFM